MCVLLLIVERFVIIILSIQYSMNCKYQIFIFTFYNMIGGYKEKYKRFHRDKNVKIDNECEES